MSVEFAFVSLCSAAALAIVERNRSSWLELLGKVPAGMTTVPALISFYAAFSTRVSGLGILIRSDSVPQGPEIVTATCFLFSGIAILLVQAHRSFGAYISDAIASFLTLLILILGSESLFAHAKVPGASAEGLPSLAILVCVALLSIVIIIRRGRHGVFSVFLGNGIGGRIARILAPIVILLSLARELGRAQIVSTGVISTHYVAAVLVSTAIMISVVLIIFLSRLINNMQYEIENLTLRDELTGLYSYRGFNLFAEQAFRLARRAGQPFGVLFVDMDNLKVINDELGHQQGSSCLVQIAKLLTATFRETDVIGRLGGDEFVVAGQLDGDGMLNAMERLRSSARQARIPGAQFPLSLSLGYAVSKGGLEETMKSVLSRADKAMSKEKRSKKASVPVSPAHAARVPNAHAGGGLGSASEDSADEAIAAL
jgi:diguanylate cyclase (GGDEF)-like protein